MQQTQQTLPISSIVLGANPRRFFDDGELDQLADSISELGLLQPIVVRETPGGFELVAGERRLKAWQKLYGDTKPIPVTIHGVGLDIDVAALVENTLRADMSPTEEAEAAYKLVLRLKGDMDEACRRLAWRPEFLKRRLALMAASEPVRTALNTRQILLGHAELLATLPQERQEKALKAVIAHSISVADLKKQLAGFAQELANAIFDKKDCATCQFNSDQQSSLFAETVDTGRCTNPPCYAEKTHEALELRAEELRKTGKYPVVKLVSAESEGTYVPVDASTVGDEQIVACRACANYGASVSESPAALGEVTEGLCFELGCNQQKVQAFQAALKQTPPAPIATADTKGEEEEERQELEDCSSGSCGVSAPASARAAKAPQEGIRPSTALIAYRRAAWNLAFQKWIVKADAAMADAIIVTAVATRNVANAKVEEAVKAVLGERATVANMWAAAAPSSSSDKKHLRVRQSLAYSIGQALSVEDFKTLVVEGLGVSLADSWKIDQEFLGFLTKGDLKFLADEIGVPQSPKMFAGKKEECITEFLAAEGKGFSFAGIVPKVMQL